MYVFGLKLNRDPWAYMAILQSRLFLFLYRVANQGESRVIPQVKASKLQSLPIPDFEPSDPTGVMLSLGCKAMLSLNKSLAETNTPEVKTRLQREIEATDRRIDQLVYELYGLKEAEIKIVEEAVQ